jgi:hypothetical protein
MILKTEWARVILRYSPPHAENAKKSNHGRTVGIIVKSLKTSLGRGCLKDSEKS